MARTTDPNSSSQNSTQMISVLILTYNEEANIVNCIKSLPWRQDVHVLDSHSEDRTVELACKLGAKVTKRPFEGYASQRNIGLALPFNHEWIVMLDADECMTQELAREIELETKHAVSDVAMFKVRRRDIFLGRWLRRASGYPTWFPRIFRRGRVTVQREINETYLCSGLTHRLEGHLEHFPLRKGMEWWFNRHNQYSSMEAQLIFDNSSVGFTAKSIIDSTQRRAVMKSFSNRLPFRPYLVFMYLYIFRGGFLDGRAGWIYANMRLAYEIMIDAKAASMRYENCPPPARAAASGPTQVE